MNQQPNTTKRSFSFWKRPTGKKEGSANEVPQSSKAVKGSVDIPFLLITVALVLFGCVMIYSASFVFAQKHHDSSTYFIIRHVIFLMMAVAFTTVVVKYCTPRFWYGKPFVIYPCKHIRLFLRDRFFAVNFA